MVPSVALRFALRIGFIQRHWPEVYALVGTPQEPEWHAEGDVWQHTLQVVDAAASIADREIGDGRLRDTDRLVLIAGALCHDLGKPATTATIGGRITSRGHEDAGVPLARRLLDRVVRWPALTRHVLPLVAEHMRPPLLYQSEQRGESQHRAVRALERRLRTGKPGLYPDGGSSLYLLTLIAEADQRGRNPHGTTPLARHQVQGCDEWRSWMLDHHEALQRTAQPATPYITASDLLEQTSIGAGPALGVVLTCVELDQRDGLVASPAEAVQRAQDHYERLSRYVEQMAADAHRGWSGLRRRDDPRCVAPGAASTPAASASHPQPPGRRQRS
jgi:tRNA nucleotidyltransferase (CCA-adding enzyme)